MWMRCIVDNGDGEEEQPNNTIEIDIEVAMGNDHHDSQMMTQDISDDDDDANGDEDDEDDDAGNRGYCSIFFSNFVILFKFMSLLLTSQLFCVSIKNRLRLNYITISEIFILYDCRVTMEVIPLSAGTEVGNILYTFLF
jgi:hypothetical protein